MSRVVIIGGTGHVGTYLVPRLVCAGFEVINVSRGERAPYQPHGGWKSVRTVKLSREAEEEADAFGRKIRELRPDIVIDMICFTEASARHLVEALRGQVRHFLHTGTIWVHGPSVEVPTTEMQPRRPFGEYGIAKAQIEAYLIETARRDSFPATVIHPGHIVGPGWAPLNPAAGHFNPAVFTVLAKGEELAIGHSPNCSIAKATRMLDYRPRYGSIRGRVRIGELADRERDRAGRPRNGLSGSCRATRNPGGR
jgi:nucleoside-diphosphate-sugar epimerase